MKNLFALLLILLICALPLKAQTKWTDYNTHKAPVGTDLVLVFTGQISSTDSLVSDGFEVSKFNNTSFMTSPPSFQFVLPASGTKISCKVLGCFKNSNVLSDWVAVDTAMTADSTTTPTQKDLNLNNKHYPYYKLLFHGATGNGTSKAFQGRLYFWKDD